MVWGECRGASHDDPAAALMVDGQLMPLVEVERGTA